MSRLKQGDYIELVAMPFDPFPIEAGARGTVTRVVTNMLGDDRDQVEVDWENGRKLALVVPPDEARVLNKEAAR